MLFLSEAVETYRGVTGERQPFLLNYTYICKRCGNGCRCKRATRNMPFSRLLWLVATAVGASEAPATAPADTSNTSVSGTADDTSCPIYSIDATTEACDTCYCPSGAACTGQGQTVPELLPDTQAFPPYGVDPSNMVNLIVHVNVGFVRIDAVDVAQGTWTVRLQTDMFCECLPPRLCHQLPTCAHASTCLRGQGTTEPARGASNCPTCARSVLAASSSLECRSRCSSRSARRSTATSVTPACSPVATSAARA